MDMLLILLVMLGGYAIIGLIIYRIIKWTDKRRAQKNAELRQFPQYHDQQQNYYDDQNRP